MKPLPHFVQSPLLRSVPGVYHAFRGVDPVEGRGMKERLTEVFAISPEAIGTLKQVHSAKVLAFEAGDAGHSREREEGKGTPSGRKLPARASASARRTASPS